MKAKRAIHEEIANEILSNHPDKEIVDRKKRIYDLVWRNSSKFFSQPPHRLSDFNTLARSLGYSSAELLFNDGLMDTAEIIVAILISNLDDYDTAFDDSEALFYKFLGLHGELVKNRLGED